MKKRIFINMCALALLTGVVTSALALGVLYARFFDNMKKSAAQTAELLAAAVDALGVDYLISLGETKSRITLVAPGGGVIYDSVGNKEEMENHAERPEIAAALVSGRGEAARMSGTLDMRTYYYALKLSNGDILRVAHTADSVYSQLVALLPYLFLAAAVTVLAAIAAARALAEKIISPINKIDLESPLESPAYDELSPLLVRIARQRELIALQVSELEKRKKEFEAITDNMGEGLLVLDRRACILSINVFAIKLLKLDSKELAGRHILMVTRSKELLEAAQSALSGSARELLYEQDGKVYNIRACPAAERGGVSGAVVFLSDVTEKAAAEKQRREFSASVSHELKTPLTAISGYSEIIKNRLVKPEDTERFAEKIYAEASRLIALIDDIIKISRLDENGEMPPKESVELLSLSEEVCKSLEEGAGKKGVSLSVSGQEAAVRGIRQLLFEIIYNLCDNAIKYNHTGGSVEVGVSKSGGEILLTVKDTGIGIPPESLPRIFERFYRADKSRSKQTGGTGLGLSIVKHAAARHRAKISVESKEGAGTTVTVAFPI